MIMKHPTFHTLTMAYFQSLFCLEGGTFVSRRLA